MGVALDNDARLHELAALRDAAEAEQQSLLRRLGRSDVGDTIVGEGSGLGQVMQRVDLVSRSEVPVLILGETGTGKELVARAIHNRSDRHERPVPARQLRRDSARADRFATVRPREGRIHRRERNAARLVRAGRQGTLFLDEIGELPLDAQVRFLARAAGRLRRARRRHEADSRRRARRRRDASRSGRHGARRRISARICGIASPCFRSCCRRCATAPKTFRRLARHFAQRAAIRFGLAPVEPTRRRLRAAANATTGRAIFASLAR